MSKPYEGPEVSPELHLERLKLLVFIASRHDATIRNRRWFTYHHFSELLSPTYSTDQVKLGETYVWPERLVAGYA